MTARHVRYVLAVIACDSRTRQIRAIREKHARHGAIAEANRTRSRLISCVNNSSNLHAPQAFSSVYGFIYLVHRCRYKASNIHICPAMLWSFICTYGFIYLIRVVSRRYQRYTYCYRSHIEWFMSHSRVVSARQARYVLVWAHTGKS